MIKLKKEQKRHRISNFGIVAFISYFFGILLCFRLFMKGLSVVTPETAHRPTAVMSFLVLCLVYLVIVSAYDFVAFMIKKHRYWKDASPAPELPDQEVTEV